jgi:hypothetical protein
MMRRLHRGRTVALCAGTLLSLAAAAHNVESQPTGSAALARAKAALDSGQFAVAEAIYDSTIASARDSATKGQGYFGRAYASQRRLMADRDSLAASEAKAIVDDYRRAAELDPSLAQPAASNGSAALQAAGQKDAAVELLRERTQGAPLNAAALLRIGELFESQGLRDSANIYVARAARADVSSTEVLRAQLRLRARRGEGDSLLALSATFLKRPDAAPVVEDALLDFLETRAARGALADSSLVLCARAWAVMGLGPASFSLSEETRLRGILRLHPETKPIIEPIFDAYRPRAGNALFHDTSDWWRRNNSRHAAWSRMLRSLGDSYNGSGKPLIAESYYEAAVGLPNAQFEQPWIDLDALLPLALLYTQRAEGRSRADELVQRVDELTNMLFYGKMQAIQEGNPQRIRYFHMTLGALYAAQERWGEGARGAIYQLEHMRQMTELANRTASEKLMDPPELLEKLARGYQVTGRTADARRVAAETVTAYGNLGKKSDAARVAARFSLEGMLAR